MPSRMTDLGITKSNKYLRNAHLMRKERKIESGEPRLLFSH